MLVFGVAYLDVRTIQIVGKLRGRKVIVGYLSDHSCARSQMLGHVMLSGFERPPMAAHLLEGQKTEIIIDTPPPPIHRSRHSEGYETLLLQDFLIGP